jgi:hypothetical protein
MSKNRQAQARKRARQEALSAGIERMHSRVHRAAVFKRDTSARERRQSERTQARVGLASNILGLAAGGAATATAVRNPALRKPTLGNAGPVTRRASRFVKTPRGKAALIAAGAGGALGLQVANVGGDVVANRVLSREAGVKKSIEQSIVSKSDTADRGTGRGASLEKAWKGEPGDKRNTKYAASSVIGGIAAPGVGAVIGPVGYGIYRSGEESEIRRNASIKRRKAAIAAKKKEKERKKSGHVEKRNFNAEADRQRRLGAYAGIGIGTGIASGYAAARGTGIDRFSNAEGRVIGIRGPKGEMTRGWKGRKAGLAALALASTAGGAVAYRQGVSERNRTYG